MKFLIIGLGNPGAQYEHTRHNIGFKVLDRLASISDVVFSTDRYGDICEFMFRGRKIILVKPSTFMNLSGKSVRYWMKKKNIDEFLEKKVEDGRTVSPILPSDVKNYLIDIDGTICDDIPNEEPERMETAKLYPDALETLNRWYDQGHVICFFTSRTEDHRAVTEKWLNNNGFKYHSLVMGKPRGGNYHWIDNHLVKATRYNGKFTDLIEKKVTIEVFDDEESNK